MSFELQVNPSLLEVDYDKNLTELYKAITDQDWEEAVKVCQNDPVQAATWVVRHYDDDTVDKSEQEVMWRFLPIHSACARQPPASVVAALIKAYPDGPRCIDDQGMYALHYACGNQANRDVIRQLLVSCPEAARLADPRGMLPLHYLACWGPSSVSLIDMMLVSNREVALARDDEGNTPLDLAMDGDYNEKDEVIEVLRRWLGEDSLFDMESHDSSKRSRSMSQSSKAVSARTVNSVLLQEEQEEKRDDSSYASSVQASAAVESQSRRSRGIRKSNASTSRHSVASTHSLTSSQAKMMKATELEKDVKMQLARQKEQYEVQLARQKEEYEARLAEQRKELDSALEQIKTLTTTERDLSETKGELQVSNEERDGLRSTLGDLMEQHESYKKKDGMMNDRLGSLSAGLQSMLEQQAMLQKSMQLRNESVAKCYETRKKLLQELNDMEDTIVSDEEKLTAALDKQTRELNAISAVIKAARE